MKMQVKTIVTALAALSLAGSCFAQAITYKRTVTISGDVLYQVADPNKFVDISPFTGVPHANMASAGPAGHPWFSAADIQAMDDAAVADLNTFLGINATCGANATNYVFCAGGIRYVYNADATTLIGFMFPYAENYNNPPASNVVWPANYEYISSDSKFGDRGAKGGEPWTSSGFGTFFYFLTGYTYTGTDGIAKTAQPTDIFFRDANVWWKNLDQSKFEIVLLESKDDLGKSFADTDGAGGASFGLFANATDLTDTSLGTGEMNGFSATVHRSGNQYNRLGKVVHWKN